MKKISFKNLKTIVSHPSFWKIIGIILTCIVVFKNFSDHTKDTSQRQSIIPIAIQLSATQYTPVLKLSGHTKPQDHGILKANFKAFVDKILIQKGRLVKKGDLILVLSCPEIEKRFIEAKSRHKQKGAEYEAAKKLTQKAFKSENTYLATKADYELAVANLHKAATDANELEITAPEDGYLEECYVHVGDTVLASDKLVQIVYEHADQVRLYVSEDNVGLLKLGMKASVNIADNQYFGKVSGISKMADTNTRNFYVDLTINTNANSFPYGATAEANISLPTRKGFWINASALTLNDEGVLGVKILENGKVAFVAVKLSSLTEEGAYIEYDAPSLGLISYGGEFLLPGQTPVVHWQKNPTL
jgi:multidrug efflux system membrane fusion protein